jgi:hypothetical protein
MPSSPTLAPAPPLCISYSPPPHLDLVRRVSYREDMEGKIQRIEDLAAMINTHMANKTDFERLEKRLMKILERFLKDLIQSRTC